MYKKGETNIYKGSRRDIKINRDIYLVRSAKERSRDEELIRLETSQKSIFENIADTSQKLNITVTTESTVKADDLSTKITAMIDPNEKKPNAKDEVKPSKQQELKTSVEVASGKNKKDVNKIIKDVVSNEIEIYDDTLEEFKSSELCIGQTQNEREALDSSSLFSLAEKKVLRINSYMPVLVDTMLLEKLVRLDKNIAKKLIMKVFKQLDEVTLPNEEVFTNLGYYPDGRPEANEDMEFTAVIKTKEKKTNKKISIKNFLINQMYNLLHCRLMRNKERPAEILFYLILKLATKKCPIESEVNTDVKRVKDKIKEYARIRKERLKKNLSKQRKRVEEGGTKKKKTAVKKNQKKVTEEGDKHSESVKRNSRRNALAHKLLKAQKGIVVADKEKKDKQINEFLSKNVHLKPSLGSSDAAETSSSDLS